MEKDNISALFHAFAVWAQSRGAGGTNPAPGLWRGRTEPCDGIGPLAVTYNPHAQTLDNLPQYHCRIDAEGGLPIAIVTPLGGMMMHSRNEGEDEDALIAHFKAQTPEPHRD